MNPPRLRVVDQREEEVVLLKNDSRLAYGRQRGSLPRRASIHRALLRRLVRVGALTLMNHNNSSTSLRAQHILAPVVRVRVPIRTTRVGEVVDIAADPRETGSVNQMVRDDYDLRAT